jgi:hypothetical protein
MKDLYFIVIYMFFSQDEFNNTGHYMILVSVSGSVRYKGQSVKLFYQNFILRAFESKWKIVSDVYRFAE